jgi:hypothetical protein
MSRVFLVKEAAALLFEARKAFDNNEYVTAAILWEEAFNYMEAELTKVQFENKRLAADLVEKQEHISNLENELHYEADMNS